MGMKVFFKKQKSNIITYPSYKQFSNEVFISDIQNRISQVTSKNKELELSLIISIKHLVRYLKTHCNKTTIYLCANQAPLINKAINKEIIKMSQLTNKLFNRKIDIDRKAYNKALNLCVSLARCGKKNVFN